jgi:hypothetical protein
LFDLNGYRYQKKSSSHQTTATLNSKYPNLMYELINFENQPQNQTYGRDAFGEFGTILASDSDLAIPELSDFHSDPQFQIVGHKVSTETTEPKGRTTISYHNPTFLRSNFKITATKKPRNQKHRSGKHKLNKPLNAARQPTSRNRPQFCERAAQTTTTLPSTAPW